MSRSIAALPLLKQGKRWYAVLVTSRSNGAWIIPKGQPEKKHSNREVASIEAYEEAGVVGKVRPNKITAQCRPTGREQVSLTIYPLMVEGILRSWPEKKQRRRELLPLEKAVSKLTSKRLQRAVRKIAKRVTR